MARWWKELGCVALVGAVCGTVIPRVLLPPTVHARGIPLRVRAAERRQSAVPIAARPITARAPESPGSPSLAEPPAAAVTASSDAPTEELRAAEPSRSSHLPRGLRRARGRWLVDLQGVESPRALLEGMHVTPPTEPGGVPDGYRVERTDRGGYARAAGIRPGDVLVAVDGRPLRSPDDALDAYIAARHATRVSLTFRRGAARYEVPVEVVGRDDGDAPPVR